KRQGIGFRILGLFIFVFLYPLIPIPHTLSFVPCLYGAYNDFGIGARMLGAGGAASAVGDDIYAPALNPAGLAYLKRAQMAFEYGRLHLNLSDGSNLFNGFAGAAYPFIKSEIVERRVFTPASVALSSPPAVSAPSASTETAASPEPTGSTRLGVETGISRTLSSAVMFSYRSMNLSEYYSESVFNLAYARFLGRRLAVGVAVKALSDSFIGNEYLDRSGVFDYGKKLSKTSFTGDIGFIWNPFPRFFVGGAAMDFTEPDIGYLETDRLCATYRLGVGMRKSDSMFACDASYAPRAKNLEISSGFERRLGDIAALRGGLVYGRFENSDSWRITTGMGFEISDSIALDYAVIYPLTVLKNTYGSHWVSFIFRFGKVPPDEIEPGSLERAYQELSEEKSRLESRLVQTEAEKRRLEEVLIEESTVRIRERIKQARDAARHEASRPQDKAGADVAVIKGVTGSRTHIVQRGDTLQSLSEKYYKDSKLWIEIYNANRNDIGRGGTLKINQVLVIPPHAQRASVPSLPSPRASDAAAETSVLPAPPSAVPVPEIKIVPSPAAPEISPESAPKERPPVKPKSSARSHTVIQGENLRSIAAKYYNDPEKWRAVLDANKDKIVRGQIRPGTQLVIP
ncbi:MAG: LysM peptidoglycan-binding domain-containing protein, partial [Endomicrobiia bacterium]|nr:LysM peptidoglycan-binding domain-containing protein [Endomicrobiia bacterium]